MFLNTCSNRALLCLLSFITTAIKSERSFLDLCSQDWAPERKPSFSPLTFTQHGLLDSICQTLYEAPKVYLFREIWFWFKYDKWERISLVKPFFSASHCKEQKFNVIISIAYDIYDSFLHAFCIEIFKNQLDIAMSSLLWLTLLWAGETIFRLPTQRFCHSIIPNYFFPYNFESYEQFSKWHGNMWYLSCNLSLETTDEVRSCT